MPHTIVLRKVGGSIMLALPPALLDLVELGPGQPVAVSVSGRQIIVEPQPRPRYKLADLLSRCDPNAPLSEEAREWFEAGPAGNELI